MGEAEEEEVQEAEEAGARKRKRGAGGEAEGDASGVEDAAEGGAYDKEDLLVEDGAGEGFAEEAVAEVMRWLEAEIAGPPPAGPGFVTINGNEESCGPSFSAAASTVMASVDTRAGAPPPPPVPLPWPWPDPVPAAGAAPARKRRRWRTWRWGRAARPARSGWRGCWPAAGPCWRASCSCRL